jgi:hypothetical protein
LDTWSLAFKKWNNNVIVTEPTVLGRYFREWIEGSRIKNVPQHDAAPALTLVFNMEDI